MARESFQDQSSRARAILSRLKTAYPDAHCELNYSSPLHLLVATILSANLIADNGGSGVVVLEPRRRATPSMGTRSMATRGFGIDLDNDGVTPNHSGGPISGGNGLLNYPVLNGAASDATHTIVGGTLNGAVSTQYRIEFFASILPTLPATGRGRSSSVSSQ